MCKKCGIKPGELMGKYQANQDEILKDLVDKMQMGFILIAVDNYGQSGVASNLPKNMAIEALEESLVSINESDGNDRSDVRKKKR